jgi:predicted negative regulator of RcsB-dependent stress response
MTIMMWVMGAAIIFILIGFVGIIGYVNIKMEEVDSLRESLIEWQNYVEQFDLKNE